MDVPIDHQLSPDNFLPLEECVCLFCGIHWWILKDLNFHQIKRPRGR